MDTGANPIDRLHAIIIGQVQGVGFRYFVKHQAESLAVKGWVRNLPEGQVEVMAEGLPGSIDQLIRSISLGPPGAIVIEVTQTRSQGTGEFINFIVDTRGSY